MQYLKKNYFSNYSSMVELLWIQNALKLINLYSKS